MFKQLIAFTLLLAFAMQIFSKAFIIFDYFTNTKTFAKNCVNKAKPKLLCKGKCQMIKKLKQEEKKDQQNPERKADNKDEVLSTKSFFASLPPTLYEKEPILYANASKDDIVCMPRSCFHPPAA